MEYAQVFPFLILYSKNRKKFLGFINENIFSSSYFFQRRYSINFFRKVFEILSFDFIINQGLLDNIYSLINDENNCISSCMVKILYDNNKKIICSSKSVFQDLIKILSKINKTNLDNKKVSLKNFDIEKNRIINNILNIDIEKINDKELLLIKDNENTLLTNEKEIFLKEKNNTPNNSQTKNFVSSQQLNSSLNFSQSLKLNNKNIDSGSVKNIFNSNPNLLCICQKDSCKKRKSKIEKSSSAISIMNHLTSKKVKKNILPKIKSPKQEPIINMNNSKQNYNLIFSNDNICRNDKKGMTNNNGSPTKACKGAISSQNRLTSSKLRKKRNSNPVIIGHNILNCINCNNEVEDFSLIINNYAAAVANKNKNKKKTPSPNTEVQSNTISLHGSGTNYLGAFNTKKLKSIKLRKNDSSKNIHISNRYEY